MSESKKTSASRVMTIKEVSAFLKLPLSTLYDLTHKGKIPATKFGKHWRYLEEDILAYLRGESCRRPAPVERRKHDRIRTELTAALEASLEQTQTSQGIIRNLSEGGALFETADNAHAWKAGDPVRMEFQLNSESSPSRFLHMDGRIVRREKTHTGEQLGIKFRQLMPEHEEALHDYVG